ncbi:MAG: type II toxin-antitoxin system HicA family toxin [Acidobacteria bacterium]|nr:type II toxin-antitoxin system HicA family toxin [Acidobacteriota bacterium]MBE3124747.1 type II toxin-antitoxin system HicA family toxin [Acidobacteriota bacterium]
MKRKELIRHIQSQACCLLREGRKHSVYVNGSRGTVSTVPRHKEIDEFLVRKICRDLEIPCP